MTAAEGLRPMTEPARAAEDRLSKSERREAVFETAFLAYYARTVAVLTRLLGERGRAEELANDVFVKLYRQPWLPDSDGNLAGWLYRTATNAGIDALRAQARLRRYEEAAAPDELAPPAAPDPLQEVLREEQRRHVRAVLARLKPSRAQILTLRACGLSYNELAEALEVKRASVGVMLARAQAEFQKCFIRMFGEEEQS
jgi:RNA polymerase sigma-70 factor (ECF subfamily)